MCMFISVTIFGSSAVVCDPEFWTNRGHIASLMLQIPVSGEKLAHMQPGVRAHTDTQRDSLGGGFRWVVIPVSGTEKSIMGRVYCGLNSTVPAMIPSHTTLTIAIKTTAAIVTPVGMEDQLSLNLVINSFIYDQNSYTMLLSVLCVKESLLVPW